MWGSFGQSSPASERIARFYSTRFYMTTEETLDPSQTTPATEPPSSETDQPSETEPTESVEELKKKLAAAETEANRWKGRVEKATKSQKKAEPTLSEEDLDWKIANVDRIKLVKEAYQKELDELASTGAKLTNTLREKALKLAEAQSNIKTTASDGALPSPEIDRSGSKPAAFNQYAKSMGVKQETIEKFKDYVEGV